jgi:hypothetical protein
MLTGSNIISYKTLEKIRDFYNSGWNGLVIATTMLPFQSAELGADHKVVDLVREIFGVDALAQNPSMDYDNSNDQGGRAIFFPNPTRSKLSGALSQNLADLRFNPVPTLTTDHGKFSYIHKVKDGKDIYYFANSSDESIETEVLLRGELSLENWNPHDGRASKLDGCTVIENDGQTYTKCHLKLHPVRSTFWVTE